MRTNLPATFLLKLRFTGLGLLLLALSGPVLFSGCSKGDSDNGPAGTDGTVTWTHNGKTYTSTVYASAIVDSGDKIIVTGGSEDSNNIVSLGLQGINAKGAGVYELRKGTVLNDQPVAVITLNGTTAQGTIFNTLYGPSTSNGTITVSQYDKAGQKISGTFSFTAGALPNTSAKGTQSVTNGTFSFTRFH